MANKATQPPKNSSKRSQNLSEKVYDTIVVGGGMAGLTTTAYLAMEGRSVLLVEKNRECGGLVNSFQRKGYRFEAGVRALENAGIILPMLKELGIDLEVVKSDVSVGIEQEVLNIVDVESLKAYQKMLEKFFPESKGEIERLMQVIRKVMKQMDVLYGVENPNFKDFRNDRAYLFKQLLPWLPRFLTTIGKINRMNMPVEPYLDEMISDRSLRDIISQHFFKNTPTFFALSYFSLYLDYFYPKGGVGELATSVEKRTLELGGQILKETSIEKLIPAKRQLIDHKGNRYQYKNLVWAADLKTLYRSASCEGLSATVCTKVYSTKEKVLVKRGGDSVYSLYLMVDEPPETFKEIAHGHFFYSPSRKGLGDTHWGEMDKLLSPEKIANKKQVLDWLDRYISLNTFEISIPVLKDPALAPPGKTGVIVSLLTEYDLYRMISNAGWYKEFVSEMEKRIIDVLSRSVYPMLKGKLEDQFSFTPLSYANRVGSSEGAITGWSFQEPAPVPHKILESNRAVKTPFPNIYQAGQWTYSPAGVPMSILTGKLAAKKAMKK